jgi:hypothetical protein
MRAALPRAHEASLMADTLVPPELTPTDGIEQGDHGLTTAKCAAAQEFISVW